LRFAAICSSHTCAQTVHTLTAAGTPVDAWVITPPMPLVFDDCARKIAPTAAAAAAAGN